MHSIYVNKAVVSVTNVANPASGNVGNTGTFTLTATNGGPDSATDVQITDLCLVVLLRAHLVWELIIVLRVFGLLVFG